MRDRNFTMFETAIGRCGVAWNAHGIITVQLPQQSLSQTLKRIMQRCGEIDEAPPPDDVQRAIGAISELLNGEARDLTDVALDLEGVPDFNRSVYDIARTIPPGKTLTYGDIAKNSADWNYRATLVRRSGAIRVRSWCRAIACLPPVTSPADFRPMAASSPS